MGIWPLIFLYFFLLPIESNQSAMQYFGPRSTIVIHIWIVAQNDTWKQRRFDINH